MSERSIRVIEALGALLVAVGAGLIYLPAGLIVLGALVILGMQGVRPSSDRTDR